MLLLATKITAAVIIFFTALIAGILPIRTLAKQVHLLTLANIFASGIFLGVALFHMLPSAISEFNLVSLQPYFNSILWCLITLVLLTLFECSIKIINRQKLQQHFSAYLLLLILIVHSFIEGSALGINTIMTDTIIIFIAIMVHKGSASFALALALSKAQLAIRKATLLLILFALMTPLGIILASIMTITLQNQQAQWLQAYFNAIAAGTFLYLGIFHSLREHISCKHYNFTNKIIALSGGFLLMGIISIWV